MCAALIESIVIVMTRILLLQIISARKCKETIHVLSDYE